MSRFTKCLARVRDDLYSHADLTLLVRLAHLDWPSTPPPGVFRKDINPWELLTNFSQEYHSKRLWDAHNDFASKYAYGFSIALDPVLCCAGVKESSAVGFGMVSDALLFYSMVQGHFR